ncbi:hypothetical protein [Candidatus Poriferisodalis sp.]|uniref:hypothetical protein n=1 Tax=Candidatus Poriferisodalis sp. TaxID=3101277 RepID=UPI003AF9A05F
MALADNDAPVGRRLLKDFALRLRGCDDEMRLRIVLHEFGLVWEDTPLVARLRLVADEPGPVDARWDAFLAAYVEHRCMHEGITAPAWVYDDARYFDQFWFPGPDLDFFRVEAIVHSPAAFEARRVFLPARELLVV